MKLKANRTLAVVLVLATILAACTLPPPPVAQQTPAAAPISLAEVEQNLMAQYSFDSWYADGLPYVLPGMDQVKIEEHAYRMIDATSSLMYVYYPPDMPADARLPVVVIPSTLPDDVATQWFGGSMAQHPQNRYFSMLFATDGFIAVGYDTMQSDDFDAVMAYMTSHADEMHMDLANMGLWSCCFYNVFTTSYAQQPGHENVKFIVNYFGGINMPDKYLYDAWHDWCAQAGCYTDFPDVAAYRKDLPMLVIRAGQNQDPLPTGMIDHFVQDSLRENLDVTFINYPEADLGFEAFLAKAPRTGQIIAQTLAFMHDSLNR